MNIHRLVASAWVVNPDPASRTVVNHIDGNPNNPDASNLEWTTQLGNLLHAIDSGLKPNRLARQPIEGRDPETEIIVDEYPSVPAAAAAHDLDETVLRAALDTGRVLDGLTWNRANAPAPADEIWVDLHEIDGLPLDHILYSVSNCGRVKNRTSGRILTNHVTGHGYCGAVLTLEFKRSRMFFVHRLVIAAFGAARPSQDAQVDHINGDKRDNRAENLQWLRPLEHATKTHGVRVRQEDITGRLVAIYPSEKAAAVAVKRSQNQISRAVRGIVGTCAGFVWKRENPSDPGREPEITEANPAVTKINGTSVVQKTHSGEIISTYATMRAAALAVGGRHDAISKAVRRVIPTYKGYIWDRA